MARSWWQFRRWGVSASADPGHTSGGFPAAPPLLRRRCSKEAAWTSSTSQPVNTRSSPSTRRAPTACPTTRSAPCSNGHGSSGLRRPSTGSVAPGPPGGSGCRSPRSASPARWPRTGPQDGSAASTGSTSLPVEALVVRGGRRRRAPRGVVLHETLDLKATDVDEVDGIACTSLIRTLVDLPASGPRVPRRRRPGPGHPPGTCAPGSRRPASPRGRPAGPGRDRRAPGPPRGAGRGRPGRQRLRAPGAALSSSTATSAGP